MKIVFISNFMTAHQSALSTALAGYDGVDYLFIETCEPDSSFQSVDFGTEPTPRFLVRFADFRADRKKYARVIDSADIVIHGSAPDSLITRRINDNKITFKYSERFYKEGFYKHSYIRNYLAAWLHHGRFRRNRLYMLCSSAYTAADCMKFGNYAGKCYKWGYFPKTDLFDARKAVSKKRPGSIVWASRFIDWKHPEIPVEIAKRLKKDGYEFTLTLCGKGEMLEEISSLIDNEGLGDRVFIDTTRNSEDLRELMKQSSIFLHTANGREGWGVVLNEAMNSACAVVAGHTVGAVPYLIKDKENGVIFENGNIDDLYIKIRRLLDDPEKAQTMGQNAYETVISMWNAENAARRFVSLAEAMLGGDMFPDLFDDGPCSKAPILNDDWYKSDGTV